MAFIATENMGMVARRQPPAAVRLRGECIAAQGVRTDPLHSHNASIPAPRIFKCAKEAFSAVAACARAHRWHASTCKSELHPAQKGPHTIAMALVLEHACARTWVIHISAARRYCFLMGTSASYRVQAGKSTQLRYKV